MAKRVWVFLKGEVLNVVYVAVALYLFISTHINTLALVVEVLIAVTLFAFALLF
jgi:hypothetical protein